MKCLRHIGLASSLVIVGILGGLMVPLPSEASNPTLTISVDATAGGFGSVADVTIPFDAVTGGSVANGVACASGDATNYNICYKIKTYEENGAEYGPAQRKVRIMNAIGTDSITQDARLLISDCAGANCLEKMVLTGVRIVPSVDTWNSSLVKVTLKFHNFFDFAPNDTTLGDATSSYRLPLSITGVFKETAPGVCSSAATAGCPVNDEMHMWGRGIFCTSASATDCPASSTGPKTMDLAGGGGNSANVDRTTCTSGDSPLCRMYSKVANTAAADVRFDKAQQGVNYPGFRCNNGLATTPTYNPLTNIIGSVSGKKCTADITAFIEFKLYGADVVNADGSPRTIGGNCGTPKAPPCNCTGGSGKKQCLDEKIAELVEDEVGKEKQVQVGIPDEIFCDPVTICNGTINNFIQLTPLTLQTFPFTAIGPDVNNFSITSDTGMASPFTNAFTGPGGTIRVLAPDYTNGDWSNPNGGFYAVDQIHVTDVNGNAVGPPAVEVFSCSGGNKGPVIIHDLRGTYNILFHIHKTQQPGVLCQ